MEFGKKVPVATARSSFPSPSKFATTGGPDGEVNVGPEPIRNVPSPLPNKIMTPDPKRPPKLNATSSFPSPLKSPTLSLFIEPSVPLMLKLLMNRNVPSPFPRKLETVEEVMKPGVKITTSIIRSPLKSAARRTPANCESIVELPNEMAGLGLVMAKKATLEVPPPGARFTTVIQAVPTVAISAAGMAAVNCAPPTKVVGRALPFQFTTDLGTKPVPFTVSVNAGPPGGA